MNYILNISLTILVILNAIWIIRNTTLLLSNKKKKKKLRGKLIEEKIGFRLVYIAITLIILAVIYGMYIAIDTIMSIAILTMVLDKTMMLTYKKSIYTNGISTNNQIIQIDDILSSSLRSYKDMTEIDFMYNGKMKLVNPNHLTFKIDNKDKEIIEKIIMIYQPS